MKRYRKFKRRTARDIRRPGKAHGLDWRAAAWRASRPGKRGEQALEVLQDMFMTYYPEEFQEKIEQAKRWGDRGTVSLRIRMMEASAPEKGLHIGPAGSDDLVLWSNWIRRTVSGAKRVEFKTTEENQDRPREPKAAGYGFIRSVRLPFWDEAESRAPGTYRFLGWRRIKMGNRSTVSSDRKDLFAVWINTRAPRARIYFAKLAQNELDPRRWPRLRWAKSKIGRNESL